MRGPLAMFRRGEPLALMPFTFLRDNLNDYGTLASPLRIAARLSRTDPPSVEWQETISGTPIQVEQALVDGLARALAGRRGGVELSADVRARLGKLPTQNAAAMMAYVESQALLD